MKGNTLESMYGRMGGYDSAIYSRHCVMVVYPSRVLTRLDVSSLVDCPCS